MCFIMIEFTGYLTGAAKKYFFKRGIKYLQNIFLGSAILVSPPIVIFALRIKSLLLIAGYIIAAVATLILPYMQVKLDKDKYVPKLIRIQDNILLSVSDGITESRYIEEVKEVRDYGEYYALVFPMGKLSEKFVCQKNLLTKGTLEEFEALFEGKIVKK